MSFRTPCLPAGSEESRFTFCLRLVEKEKGEISRRPSADGLLEMTILLYFENCPYLSELGKRVFGNSIY